MRHNNLIFEIAFALLRYCLEGHRPSQTTSHKLFFLYNNLKGLKN